MQLNQLQKLFSNYLQEGTLEESFLHSIDGNKNTEIQERLTIYRNNYYASLVEVLASTYPSLKTCLGEHNFSVLAKEYIKKHPPITPVLLQFGDKLSAFLKSYRPTKENTLLESLAELNWYQHLAYWAENIENTANAEITRLNPNALSDTQVACNPSAYLFTPQQPVFLYWQNLNEKATPQVTHTKLAPEYILVIRNNFEVETYHLEYEAYLFLKSLNKGNTIGEALGEIHELNSEYDLSSLFAFTLQSNFICTIK